MSGNGFRCCFAFARSIEEVRRWSVTLPPQHSRTALRYIYPVVTGLKIDSCTHRHHPYARKETVNTTQRPSCAPSSAQIASALYWLKSCLTYKATRAQQRKDGKRGKQVRNSARDVACSACERKRNSKKILGLKWRDANARAFVGIIHLSSHIAAGEHPLAKADHAQ